MEAARCSSSSRTATSALAFRRGVFSGFSVLYRSLVASYCALPSYFYVLMFVSSAYSFHPLAGNFTARILTSFCMVFAWIRRLTSVCTPLRCPAYSPCASAWCPRVHLCGALWRVCVYTSACLRVHSCAPLRVHLCGAPAAPLFRQRAAHQHAILPAASRLQWQLLGAKDCTPEIDTSEIIMDVDVTFRWDSIGISQCMFTCSVAWSKGLSFSGGCSVEVSVAFFNG